MTQGTHWGDADKMMSPLGRGGLAEDTNDSSPRVRPSPRLSSGSLAPVPEFGGGGGGGGGATTNPTVFWSRSSGLH